jgi:indolepyruvate ferredoxin oxidoreductase beta subunit
MNAVTAPAPRAIAIAILAMGGEGGGVLADWIVDLAEHAGWIAQTTSVPGVAQRTGATIYYVEIFPVVAGRPAPVLALMPFPGEVDVVVASELMESGRALQRGLVTADRTTLVASTHRVYSMTEKMAMGDGRVDADALVASGRAAAKRAVFADFARAAEDAGSVIGASLFGALAGAGCLPFTRADFEDAVRRAGVGVDASLKAFAAGFALATEPPAASTPVVAQPAPAVGPRLAPLAQRVRTTFPDGCVATILHGCLRLADYQDIAYAEDYVGRLERLRSATNDVRLLDTVARHLALWMSYEDTIRVADLKTRASRFDRVRGEVRQRPDQLLGIGEFLHPRVQEIADTLPAGLGRWLIATGWARRTVERFASKGRVVQTSSIRGFLLLYMVASLRRFRRSSLRFAEEHARIAAWLDLVATTAQRDVELAIAVAECQRLVKGYGDTHVRGTTNYATLIAQVPGLAGCADAANLLRQLRNAALADEHGTKLAAAIAALGPNATD